MSKRFLIIVFILFIALRTYAQSFGALPYLDKKNPVYSIDKLLYDSLHDKLIISARNLEYAGTKKVRSVCSWNGSVYDSLSSGINTHDIAINPNQGNGAILCGLPFNGKFLVGGVFQSIGGCNASGLATWDGMKWDSLPKRAFRFLNYNVGVSDIVQYGNKLIIGGSFDTIQGLRANGLASYDGTNFVPLNAPLFPQANINDMEVFQGQLYISGILSYSVQAGNYDILRYDGQNWQNVGGGIKGGLSSVGSLAVFRNELYVAGYFTKSAGNTGNIVMKWNGNNWNEVNWGSEFQNGGVYKLLVYHGRLYAFGTFNLAGEKTASKIAAFDGFKWCTLSDSLDNNITTAAIYKDTIYIGGGFNSIDLDTTKRRLAKFVFPENFDNCQLSGLGIPSNNGERIFFKVFPNPASNQLNVIPESGIETVYDFEILNACGQIIKTVKNHFSDNPIMIDDLPNGFYILQMKYRSEKTSHSFIKQ